MKEKEKRKKNEAKKDWHSVLQGGAKERRNRESASPPSHHLSHQMHCVFVFLAFCYWCSFLAPRKEIGAEEDAECYGSSLSLYYGEEWQRETVGIAFDIALSLLPSPPSALLMRPQHAWKALRWHLKRPPVFIYI